MRVIRHNKQAYFNYEIVDTIEAWVVLQGHEVKSLKTGHGAINDAIISFNENELWLVNFSIPLYERTAPSIAQWYDPKQPRKLLVTKKQRVRLYERTRKTGLHIVPLKVLEVRRRIKVLIGLWKLKKKVQKRAIIKERDTKRMMDKEVRRYG